MYDQTSNAQSAPRLDCARRTVEAATMPAYAERFPEQFEHAVTAVADARLRMGICTPGVCC